MRLTHIGGPTVLLEVDGWRLLTDPTFDPPGERYHFGWGTASTKVAGPAVEVADLGPIDAVLLTHDHHADNLDDLGRSLLRDVPVILTTEAGARRLAAGDPAGGADDDGGGGRVEGLAPWTSTRLEAPGKPAIDVVGTPCRHGPPLSRPIVGQVTGFALTWPDQTRGAVWVSGDTVLYPDLLAVADRVDVGLAVLHLGGVQFTVTGPIHYTLTADDAVTLVSRLAPHTVVPVHYEGWSHFRQGRAVVEERLAKAPAEVRDAFRFVPLGTPVDLPV